MLQTSQSSAAAKPEAVVDLESGKAIDRHLAGAETHSYRIALSQGQYALVVVVQKGVDLGVRVIDAGRPVTAINSETRPQGRERVPLVSESATTYQLDIKAQFPRIADGHYEIKVKEIRPATEQDRSVFEAYKLITQAESLSTAGKYDEAIKLAQQALESGEKGLGPHDAYVGELAQRLGLMQYTKGDYANAERTLQRAITISEEARGKEDPQTALAENNLGLVYRSTQDEVKAEKFLQLALETMEKTLGKDHPSVALCLMNVASLHITRGDYPPAAAELQRALEIADKTVEPDNFLLMALPHNLGNLYLEQGDYDRAEPLTERALKAAEQKYGPDHPNVAIPLQNLGSIARIRKQYARALDLLWRAEKIREKSLGPQHQRTLSLLINIANVYKDEGDLAKALELYHQTLDALEVTVGPYHALTLMSLANMATVYSIQHDEQQALEYQARVDQVVEKQIELNLAVGSERHMLAYSDWMSGRTDRTISLHVQQFPESTKAREMAVVAVLQRKGRVLDAVSETIAALHQRLKPDDQKLLDQLAGTDTELARVALSGPGKTPTEEYKKKLGSLEAQREKLEAEVNRSTAGYFEQTTPVSLDAIRAAIPADSVLIEFAVYHPFNPQAIDGSDERFGEPRYVAYVIPHEGQIQWKELDRVKEIDRTIDSLRQALRNPERTDARQLARAAGAKIFEPLRPLLGSATHLLISPDGELSLVPIEAFCDEQGHYLVERYSISYLTSGRDLLRMQVSRPSKSGPLVIADPFFGEPRTTGMAGASAKSTNSIASRRRSVTTAGDLSGVYFAPLSGTAQEARSIQSLFPNAKVVTGQEATTKLLKQVEGPEILHIATHGFFLEDPAHDANDGDKPAASQGVARIENPLLRSGLALAGANLIKNGKADDGILTALEASNLNLWGTKLVTLSACDTGIGEVKTGEGIYGLRRAFFRAGTETLVMSLWPVSDNVTREMMTAYYAGLKKGLGRGESLHRAELALLKRPGRQHPFYWASFIQSGEWASLDGKK
ncbi:MAG TPA: CHAT domain-containing protein [Candidatus Angelobacter sp.]